MSLKEFLKPDWRKIVVVIVFALLLKDINTVELIFGFFEPSASYGFPLPFYTFYHPTASGMKPPTFNIYILAIDIIIWYILSCLIVWIYDKFKKKKK